MIKTVEFEGLTIQIDDEAKLCPGDSYLAFRNGSPRLLTVKKVNFELGCVHPTTLDYSYDIGECFKVVSL